MGIAERMPGLNIEERNTIEENFDEAVKREVGRHPELNSRRKKLIYIQETFGWNTVEMGRMLGITENQARKFLSRRGVQNIEFQDIRNEFYGLFAITSIINRYEKKLLPKRDVINRPNALLEDRGIKTAILQGDIFRAVDITERSFNFRNENPQF